MTIMSFKPAEQDNRHLSERYSYFFKTHKGPYVEGNDKDR